MLEYLGLYEFLIMHSGVMDPSPVWKSGVPIKNDLDASHFETLPYFHSGFVRVFKTGGGHVSNGGCPITNHLPNIIVQEEGRSHFCTVGIAHPFNIVVIMVSWNDCELYFGQFPGDSLNDLGLPIVGTHKLSDHFSLIATSL